MDRTRTLVAAALTTVAFCGWGETVVLPANPTAVERTAAKELAEALTRITGANYVVSAEGTVERPDYAVGETAAAKKLAAANGWGAYEVDEVRRGTLDGTVVLSGDAQRGVIYAVDTFLEDVAGVRWWTPDASEYPNRPGWKPSPLKPYRYAPQFKFRETFYHSTLFDADFKVRMKNNCTSFTRYIVPPMKEAFVPPEKGGNHKLVFFPVRRSAYHSFFMIIPPAEYFKDHPEWFSLVKGERVGSRDNNNWSKCRGQLCLTNEEMFREFVKNTKRFLRENPDCDSIQVTQNDWNHGVCECEKCKAFYDREGAVSGLYIDFANRVAAEVEKEFPNVFIDTFAYQFTRKAPKTVKPRKNVLVRLCDIECAFNRPLAKSPADYRDNVSFMRDIRDWSRVAKGNLYIWDYQANFTSYMLPHPNLHVFADNIRTFAQYGAVGIFEQGDAMCPAGDFAPLKQYVTSHLLWDPSRDWVRLADDFIVGYYGRNAAPHIWKALLIGQKAVTAPGVGKMSCYHANITQWIPDEEALKAISEMDAALAAAEREGGAYPRRVRMAKMAWDHAKIINWRRWGAAGDSYEAVQEWKRNIEDFGILSYRETISRQTLVDYLKQLDFRGEFVKEFTVDGKPAVANQEGILDLKAIYPADVIRGKTGTRAAEIAFALESAKGGKTACRYKLDWFGDLFVNGQSVRKIAGPCTDFGFLELDLKPGRNDLKVVTRSGSGGNWYFSFEVAK